jgi:hypothetical protein
MNSLIQQPAPDFRCQAMVPDGSLRELSLTEFRGKHPLLRFGELESRRSSPAWPKTARFSLPAIPSMLEVRLR